MYFNTTARKKLYKQLYTRQTNIRDLKYIINNQPLTYVLKTIKDIIIDKQPEHKYRFKNIEQNVKCK